MLSINFMMTQLSQGSPCAAPALRSERVVRQVVHREFSLLQQLGIELAIPTPPEWTENCQLRCALREQLRLRPRPTNTPFHLTSEAKSARQLGSCQSLSAGSTTWALMRGDCTSHSVSTCLCLVFVSYIFPFQPACTLHTDFTSCTSPCPQQRVARWNSSGSLCCASVSAREMRAQAKLPEAPGKLREKQAKRQQIQGTGARMAHVPLARIDCSTSTNPLRDMSNASSTCAGAMREPEAGHKKSDADPSCMSHIAVKWLRRVVNEKNSLHPLLQKVTR